MEEHTKKKTQSYMEWTGFHICPLRSLVVVSGQDVCHRQLNHTLLSGSQTLVSNSVVAECQFSISGTFEEMQNLQY